MRTSCQSVKSGTEADCSTAHQRCSGWSIRGAEVCKQRQLQMEAAGTGLLENVLRLTRKKRLALWKENCLVSS